MADHASELVARKALPLRLRPGLAAWTGARDRAGPRLAGGGAPTACAARTRRARAQGHRHYPCGCGARGEPAVLGPGAREEEGLAMMQLEASALEASRNYRRSSARNPLSGRKRRAYRQPGTRGSLARDRAQPVPRPAPVHPLRRRQPQAFPRPADRRSRQDAAAGWPERARCDLRGRAVGAIAPVRPVRHLRGDDAQANTSARARTSRSATASARRRSARRWY